MKLSIRQLTKNIACINLDNILSCWQWRLSDIHAVVTISALGDIFLLGHDGAVYWLQTDSGDLTKVAETLEEYERLLYDEKNVDNWFLPSLVEQLLVAGKVLKDNEVYSYKKSPVIGGEYSVDNIEPIDMGVHFAFSGQLCEQIKDLADGTKVSIKYKH